MKFVSLPFVGNVKAGVPVYQKNTLFDYNSTNRDSILIPINKTLNYKNALCAEVVGDSMVEHNIFQNDIVVFKRKNKPNVNDLVVCEIDGDLIIKQFKETKEYLILNSGDINIKRKKENVNILGSVLDTIKVNTDRLVNKEKKFTKLPVNEILCGKAENILEKLPSNSIDIVVTSPPYDEIRDYKGFQLDLHAIGLHLYRVLKNGGIAVMVIQDQTKNFGKSLTSFKTIIDWCDNIGFKLFECNIYRKYGAEGAWWNKRFRVDHEYMPIFLKGERPGFFNKESIKIPSKHGGKVMTGGGTRLTNGVRIKTRAIKINSTKCPGTIWEYMTAGDGTRLKHKHPATFPDKLPYDFINTFCPPKGIVLDPMCGSGTTVLAARNLKRKFIGIDISKEYCNLTRKRLEEEKL